MAQKTGVSRPNISFWENAEFPPLEGIDRVCRALNVELWEFFAAEETLSSMAGATGEFAEIMREIASLDEPSRRDVRNIMELLLRQYRRNAAACREDEAAGITVRGDKPAVPEPESESVRFNALAGAAFGTAVEDYMQRFIWLTSSGPGRGGIQ